MSPAPLPRRLVAEFVGTGVLTAAVVGSGIAAERLSPGDAGLRLLENSTATTLALAALILVLGPVSGAHLNPVVSAVAWALGRRCGGGPTGVGTVLYGTAQTLGAMAGAILANAMFDLTPVDVSGTPRVSGGHLLGEVVATAGLVTVVFVLARAGRAGWSAAAVAAWIGAAYWFTSSTSFANPAVTAGRILTTSATGIAPPSAAAFVGAQIVGAAVGAGLTLLLLPTAGPAADQAVVPHPTSRAEPAHG